MESLLRIERLPSGVKELILKQSQGNPFFTEEAVRSLIDSGILFRKNNTWRALEEIDTIDIPESVESVILSRVDRLGARLKHVLTQETVYKSIAPGRNAKLHGSVGDAIEELYRENIDEYCEQLAHHFDRSTDSDKAVEYLLLAGGRARGACSNEEAVRDFQRTLKRLEEAPLTDSRRRRRLEALRELGRTYNGKGLFSQAEPVLQEAIALGRELNLPPRAMVWRLYRLGRVDLHESEMITRLGEEGRAMLGDDTECLEYLLAGFLINYAAWEQGEPEKFYRFLR